MGGEFTYPKIVPLDLTHSHISGIWHSKSRPAGAWPFLEEYRKKSNCHSHIRKSTAKRWSKEKQLSKTHLFTCMFAGERHHIEKSVWLKGVHSRSKGHSPYACYFKVALKHTSSAIHSRVRSGTQLLRKANIRKSQSACAHTRTLPVFRQAVNKSCCWVERGHSTFEEMPL